MVAACHDRVGDGPHRVGAGDVPDDRDDAVARLERLDELKVVLAREVVPRPALLVGREQQLAEGRIVRLRLAPEALEPELQAVVDDAIKHKDVVAASASASFNTEWKYFASSEGSYIEQDLLSTSANFNVTARRGDVTRSRSLGIPGGLADAVLLSALMIHNLQPGPLLMVNSPHVVYAIMASHLVSHILMFLIMTFVGGIGNIYGSVIGAFALTIIEEYAQEFGQYNILVYGLLLALVILFLPKGLVDLPNKLKSLRAR